MSANISTSASNTLVKNFKRRKTDLFPELKERTSFSDIKRQPFRLSVEHNAILRQSLIRRRGDLFTVINRIIEETELNESQIIKYGYKQKLLPKTNVVLKKGNWEKIVSLVTKTGHSYSSVMNSFIGNFINTPEFQSTRKIENSNVTTDFVVTLNQTSRFFSEQIAKHLSIPTERAIEEALVAFYIENVAKHK